MQAVGRIGSYISKSVYTVSGPFHPFGGAVDIIVVEQPDGSYKSSPWYVRFGKFQGVLKSKEKVVNISVNDVDVDFHMHLDHKGEAFFLGEVDVEESELAFSPPSSSGEDMESLDRNRRTLKSKSCNFDGNWSDSNGSERKAVSRANSRRSQFLGLVFGRRASAEGFQVKEDASGVVRTESVELAEFTADLLDLKWSTNLPSPKSKNKDDNVLLRSSSETLKDGVYKKTRMDGSSFDATTTEENGVGMKCETSEYIIKTTTSVESVREDSTLSNSEPSDVHVSSVSIVSEVAKSDSQILDSVEKLNGLSDIQQCLGKEDQFRFVHEEKMSVSGGTTNGAPESIVTECYSQLVCVHQTNDPLKDISSITAPIVSSSSYSTCSTIDEGNILSQRENPESSEGPLSDPARGAEEELLLFGEMEGLASTSAKHANVSHSNHVEKETSSDAKLRSNYSLDQSIINDYLNDADIQRTRLCSASSDACIIESVIEESRELPRMASSLPIIGPLSDNLEASLDSDKNHETRGDQTTARDVKNLKESKDEPAHRTIGRVASLDSLEGSRSNSPFPFQRTRGIKVSNADMNGTDHSNGIKNLDIPSDLDTGTEVTKAKVIKKKVRTLTPTSEQLASLNLNEGKNTVIFTFSTSMLGKQQVDARIFLWRWDARIVISDVDGTITRSDLLGQVMPLVGMDWSQTGVAHLFSAIKDNGYQLIFLSARSISQSFITRQFLFNIKQDGKALPEGPVVISPDGLFPSLFREVVRRAPHEFKIACLEDIKALFPPGSHPFYAGFGNRDTDEVSYLKVGIPMGKIFIINPKGEIAVNRRVDTKSYSSLHDLIHGMFPLMPTCEQEDFNTWNYWKLPPPTLNL